jgi:hypothetical protein
LKFLDNLLKERPICRLKILPRGALRNEDAALQALKAPRSFKLGFREHIPYLHLRK